MDHLRPSPALSLPPEILSYVFSLSGYSLTGPRTLRLAHVCRQWREVLLGHSEYWVDVIASSNFHQDTNVSFLKFILAQSSPRRIRLNNICFSPFVTTLLAPNWHRVVFLDVKIQNRDHLRSLHTVLQHSQSSGLRELLLTFQSTYLGLSQYDLVPLPHNALPALRRLRSPIPYLPYIAVSSLRHLEVSRFSGYFIQFGAQTQTLSTLFDYLAICTELETLFIERLSPIGSEIPSKSRDIYLHRLQMLSISDTSFIHTGTILSTLRFRDTVAVSLDCRKWIQIDKICEVLPHTRPSADTLRITICDRRAIIVDLLEGSAPRLRIELGLHFPILDHMVRMFPESAGVTALEWSNDGRRLTSGLDRDWEKLLLNFPSLTRLSVRGIDGDTLAKALCRLHGPDLAPAPPCLFLAEITVAWNADEMERAIEHQMECEMDRERKMGRKVPRELWQRAGATSAARVDSIARALMVALVRRAQHDHVRPLVRVELSEYYDPSGAPSVEGMQAVENVLVLLRTLVDGPVIFTKIVGPMATPSSTPLLSVPVR